MKRKTPDEQNYIHFKDYPRFKKIILSKSFPQSRLNLETVIKKRRSYQAFIQKQITIQELSKLLYYTCGITLRNKDLNFTRRAYPSAGARYPLEVYVLLIKQGVINLGLYHYNVKSHSLEPLLEGNFQNEIKNSLAIPNGKITKTAFLFLLITAIPSRTYVKYEEQTEKFILLEAGHMIQNTYLISHTMKLGCCPVASFNEQIINKLLDIDGIYEKVIYLVAIGKL